MISASTNRRAEDISIGAVVIPKLKLRDVQWHIFGADFVERADHAALEDRPEIFNRVGVNGTNNVLAFGVIDGFERIFSAKMFVAHPLIGAEQRNFVRDGFMHERFERGGADVLDYAGDDVTLALYRADDWRFAGTNAASSATLATLVDMPVLGETAVTVTRQVAHNRPKLGHYPAEGSGLL